MDFNYLVGKKVNYKGKEAYSHFNGGIVKEINKHGHALIEKDGQGVWFWADLLEVMED